tara:strand:+ start:378 stop:875 length:498 start_codon:yes stop_codon:yes gene_type:complete
MKYLLTLIALIFIPASCYAQVKDQLVLPSNFTAVSESLITGGQPSAMDLEQLKSAGVTKVINLRTANEKVDYDEQAKAEALGFTYISLPIAGSDDVTSENAAQLDLLLQGNEKVLLHCASGNRVGALLAIRAHEIEGKPVAESLQLGRAAGMSSLEGTVESLIAD